jgi:cysteine sulfinate desulfinase/cysteine desulfurase-like protein
MGCTGIITSPIEHHAVLHTVEYYGRQYNIPLDLVSLTPDGGIDYDSLEQKLINQRERGKRSLVSLMYANNEIGSLLDMPGVQQLCRQYDAVFHSDCVQAVGHYPIDLSTSYVHYISGAGHKFHGPSVCFPRTAASDGLLLGLDQAGICVSGGSACSSGDGGGSHVIKALADRTGCNTVRFSFSKYNTREEIVHTVNVLESLLYSEKANHAL